MHPNDRLCCLEVSLVIRKELLCILIRLDWFRYQLAGILDASSPMRSGGILFLNFRYQEKPGFIRYFTFWLSALVQEDGYIVL